VVEDLGSTNGTVVNGQRIRGPLQLSNQDHITIGQSIGFTFIDDKPPVMNTDATVAADAFIPMDLDATMMASEKDALDISTPPVFETPPPQIPTEFSRTPDFSQPEPIPSLETPQWQPPAPSSQQPVKPTSKKLQAAGKKKIPIWLIIVVILLLLACLCVGGLVVIDQMNLWCDILPFLPGCPVI
jgi:hypothetical protein